MKNLLFIFSLSFIFLFSCSSENNDDTAIDDNSLVLVKKIETSEGFTMNLFYNENKLIETIAERNNFYSATKYTYAGSLISKIERYNENNQPTGYFESYEYNNNKLIKRKIYSNNNLVEEWNLTYINNKIRMYHPTNSEGEYWLYYLDSNNNVVKFETYYNNQVVQTSIITYDNKNNPYKNVLGLNLFINDWFEVSNNNQITATIETNSENYYSNHTYQYNPQNYPVSAIVFDSDDNSEVFYTYYY
ncbi:hypothetical protein [uncultured Lutibacter sp.]|uniref:hypothetical protein n=1 Tax=uncultured Lutibacter sp. TaxID=437739 RepID=UPI002632BEB9|nr:hypothetical protein [uncultured Lutibacter sp.]